MRQNPGQFGSLCSGAMFFGDRQDLLSGKAFPLGRDLGRVLAVVLQRDGNVGVVEGSTAHGFKAD